MIQLKVTSLEQKDGNEICITASNESKTRVYIYTSQITCPKLGDLISVEITTSAENK